MNGRYNLGTLGVEKVVLYDASVSGDFTGAGTTKDLYDDVRNYSYILVTAWMFTTANNNAKTLLIPTELINTSDGNSCWLFYMHSTGAIRYLGFNFTNGYDKITIHAQKNSTSSGAYNRITKVVGIR